MSRTRQLLSYMRRDKERVYRHSRVHCLSQRDSRKLAGGTASTASETPGSLPQR